MKSLNSNILEKKNKFYINFYRDKQWTDEFQQSNFTIENNLQLRNNISTATSEPTNISSTFKIAANQNSSNWAQEYLNEIPLIENSVSKEAAKLSGIHITLLYNNTDREKSVKDENYYIMCVPKLAQNFKKLFTYSFQGHRH